MQRILPELSRGLSKFEASITPPEAAPAPMIVWISSINKMALSRSFKLANNPLKRFSKSPRYLVPANSAPRSSEYTTAPCRVSGTLPSTIILASPSAMAVLPTPDSPTKSGLFLRRLASICATRSTSASRPIKGSICPDFASSFKSVA